jgi:glycosyltransferase involved in cell wall biosynthesis
MSLNAVTVIIPTRDRPQMLRRSVASALAQLDVDVDVIVVDDGSQPRLTSDDLPSEVTLLHSGTSGGVAKARNLGVEHATGGWVAFLDDDDVWSTDHLSMLLAAASHNNAAFAYSGVWLIDVSGNHWTRRDAASPDTLDESLLRENSIGSPSCVMVKRAVLGSVGGFDTELSVVADWDLWIRLADATRGARSSGATVAYVIHGTNMSFDGPRLLGEYKTLSKRYAERCQSRGVAFGEPGFSRWLAYVYRQRGMRHLAAAWYLRSARHPEYRTDVLRAIAMLTGEKIMRLGKRTEPEPVPPNWAFHTLAHELFTGDDPP